MTEYSTARNAGRIFVHSIWANSYFIAVQFEDHGKIIPFSPFMNKRFKSEAEAAAVLDEYARTRNLKVIA